MADDDKLDEFVGDNGTLGTDNLEELLKRAAEMQKRIKEKKNDAPDSPIESK